MQQAPQPLGGLRVIDFSRFVAGPQATRILSWFGAEIIKVEWPEYPGLDWMRYVGPFHGGVTDSMNRAANFNNINTGKMSITVDMRVPAGQNLLRDLIKTADAVIEAFSPTVMGRQGLDYLAIRQLRPDIIYVSQSGFGHTGSYKDFRSWGPTAQAFSGLTLTSGLPGKPPAGWGYSYMDHTAGYLTATSLLMALHHRRRTGKGQFIDVAQVQAACTLTGTHLLDYTVNNRPFRRDGMPPGNRATHPLVAPHNSYRCKGDDMWCVITVFNDRQWISLKNCMGNPAWAENNRFSSNSLRIRNQDELDAQLELWTRDQDRYAVMGILQDAGVPAGVVQFPNDRVDSDAQNKARGLHVELHHNEYGKARYEGAPFKMSRTPPTLAAAAPCIGEHNNYVFSELLGLNEDHIGSLYGDKVLAP